MARRSGVNKTLLYQYVGNKDDLFTAALEAAYQSIRERQKEFVARQMDPETGVRQLVHLLMSIWVEHQDYGKLLASENFHGGKHVKRSKLIGEMYRPAGRRAHRPAEARRGAGRVPRRTSIRSTSIFRSQACRPITSRISTR